jgi:hypothetical protein
VEDKFLNNLSTRVTFGERLSADYNIDLVAPTPTGEFELAVHNAGKTVIVPKFEHDGVIYIPPKLHSSVRSAIRFPAAIAEYGEVHDLFIAVMQLFDTHLALPEIVASIATSWIFAGWVPEYFAALPILAVTGANSSRAMNLFYLLGVLSRRAIILADLNPKLPTELGLTLLLANSALSKKAQGCWRAGNFRNVHLPTTGGRLKSLACAKAIYSENGDAGQLWGDEVLRIVLLPNSAIPIISDTDLVEIASEFQPKFQLFRLRRLQDLAQAGEVPCPVALARSPVTRELFALLGGETSTPKLLLPLAENQRKAVVARRAIDPMAVIIEAIWMPAHQQGSMATLDLQKRVNVLLGVRGAAVELSVRELGWKLTDLGLPRKRNAKGMFLTFSPDLCGQIHRLAQQFDLDPIKVDACPHCASRQVVEP